MNKTMNKLVLVLAASMMFAGSAYAGTIGCFELTKGAPVASLPDFKTVGNVVYPDCTTITTNAANTVGVAYELTGALPLQLDAYDGDAANAHVAAVQTIVYIPTTDIPSGTLIKMKLTGAVWNEGNTLVLLKDNGAAALTSVASTDGATTGAAVDTITFVTKAGITVGAGTRLIVSSLDPNGASYNYAPPKILIKNTECDPAKGVNQVTIAANLAKTDGGTGYEIQGAETAATKIVDMGQQFSEFYSYTAPTQQVVDVEIGSLRTKFVQNIAAGALDKAQLTLVPYVAQFGDNASNLDRSINILTANTAVLETSFQASQSISSIMKMKMWDTVTDGGVLADSFSNAISDGTTAAMSIGTSTASTVYLIPAESVYTSADVAAVAYSAGPPVVTAKPALNNVYFNLTNTDTGTPLTPMDYNYKVSATTKLNFANNAYIDHCSVTKETHDIGINGAILKVPYVYYNSGTFVRISNEGSNDAVVFADFFEGGAATSAGCTNILVGSLPARSSMLEYGSDLLGLIQTNCPTLYSYINGAGAGRFFTNFTVTAPADAVHGFALQKGVAGGADRAIPVYHHSNWNQ